MISSTTTAAAQHVEIAEHAPHDSAGFAEWVRPHLDKMRRVAARIGGNPTADDIVQEALVRAWRHRQRYNPARAPVATWLLGIVANEARRAARRKPVSLAAQVSSADPAELRMDVEAAVLRLPARERLAVNCFYFCGLTVGETAAVMKCSEGTVKATLSHARSHLRPLLEDPS